LANLGVVATLRAQQPTAPAAARTGRIVGQIIDAANGQGLSDAGIQIVGTTLGTSSAIEGRYVIPNVPAGTVTIQVRRLGYAPKTVTGILLDAGQVLEQNITLQAATVKLQVVQTTAANERGTVNEALDQQRTATGIVSSVTAEQITKSPDSDAAQAVQRVSGVTVQDGRYVFVRGLGERYTTASLNGARIPSPEPERRVVPLDLFPSALLQSITTSKTFTPDQPGLYTERVEATTPSGVTAGDTTFLRVGDMNSEFYDAEMRAPLLQRIARETGGRFYTPATASTLAEDVSMSKRGVTVVNQMDLWDMPVVLLLLVSLVSAEWAYRKLRGLA